MTEVIGVRFKKVGKVYYFDPNGVTVQKGTAVIVETTRGLEYGEVAMINQEMEDDKIVQPLKKVVRTATPADQQIMTQNAAFEKDAFRICEEKIAKHKLDMKLVTVEYTFDHSKILFYFSADGRVDFRELVKDLASVFRTRIELRQIGVRDEAKMIGGLGVCGCPLCCSTFLDDFQPVSINMAKDQGLSLNPAKISGTCGRLMCCLKYENDAYQDLIRQTPPNESLVDTPSGRGTVMNSSLLKGTCKIRLQNNPDSPVTVPCCQCSVLRRGRDRCDRCEGAESAPQGEYSDVSASQAAETHSAQAQDAPPADAMQAPRPQRPRQQRPYPHPPKPRKEQAAPADSREKGERTERRPQSERPRPPRPAAPETGENRNRQSGAPAPQGQTQKNRQRPNGRRGGHRSGKPPVKNGASAPPAKEN